MTLYFYISVAILSLLLFYPVSKLIWVMSVRSNAGRLHRELTVEEITENRNRARFIAILICVPFSWFFNLQLLG